MVSAICCLSVEDQSIIIPGMKAIRTTNHRAIKALSEQIAHAFNPQKIILFGSYAHGKPAWDSDVDLLVVMPFKGRPNRQAIKIRSRIDTPLALDLLVRTPRQVSRRLAMGDSFMRDIIERGKVVYEAHN
jgi:predicted nucleotidyltransferase